MSVPRLSGGAVPGGRGIGIVDLEQEEMRDSEYRARAREDGDPLGLSMTRENDTTTDGMSTAQLEGDVPRSQAGSARKTPSSTGVKRRSISTPMTPSATGAFIDHMIEIPADDDVGEKRRTPANGKQRAQTTVLGSRARPRSTSQASSSGLFSTSVEVVVPHLGGSSKDGKAKGKEKE